MLTDAARLADGALETEIRGLASTIDAALHRLLGLVVEFDERGLWAEEGCRSCAHWLALRCGIAVGAAREKLRVGRALRSLPKVDAALASGELSYSKARALTRIANAGNEDFLLSIARHGSASHLERLVAKYRGSLVAERREDERVNAARRIDGRGLTHHVDEGGMLVVRVRLPPEDGALVLRALERTVERLDADRPLEPTDPHPDVSAETAPDTPARTPIDRIDARRADAFVRIAADALSRDGCGGRRSAADRHHVTVVVDATTLAGDDAGDTAECRVEHGPRLPLDTVRRLCCDGAVSGLLEKDGRVLSVGRRTRAIPPSMRRALERRDGGCRFPGCTAHRFVDGHHVRHWAEGGETSLGNLVSLCTHHHRLVHEGGFDVERRGETFVFRTPAGRIVAERTERVSAETPLPAVAASGWGWDGSAMDWCFAVGELRRTCSPGAVGAHS